MSVGDTFIDVINNLPKSGSKNKRLKI